MKRHKYDIFISYRREGGAQYARTLHRCGNYIINREKE